VVPDLETVPNRGALLHLGTVRHLEVVPDLETMPNLGALLHLVTVLHFGMVRHFGTVLSRGTVLVLGGAGLGRCRPWEVLGPGLMLDLWDVARL
jgi:hypothetical protein